MKKFLNYMTNILNALKQTGLKIPLIMNIDHQQVGHELDEISHFTCISKHMHVHAYTHVRVFPYKMCITGFSKQTPLNYM